MSILLAYLVLFAVAFTAMMVSTSGYRVGILWQPGGLWVGVHYSPFCKRYCINLIPCVTLWIAKPDGKIPYSTR